MRIAIIGAGAAGCFCSINLKRSIPDAEVIVYESGRVPLAKVALTGGGRCNLTNSFEGIDAISDAYPRGANLMKRLLKEFGWKQTCQWFEKEKVKLVIQRDHCVFPKSQDAMEIVRTLSGLMNRLGVKLNLSCRVESIETNPGGGYIVSTASTRESFDKVIVTTGGSPKVSGLSMLESLSLEIVQPVPSLFTFNLPNQSVTELSGIVVEDASASLAGTKFSARGPLLITDWGMSGPAILKLSSYGARFLKENSYEATVNVNWLGADKEDKVRELLGSISKANIQKQISSTHPEQISSRLWIHIISKAGLRPDIKWAELGSKGLSRLVSAITCDQYKVQGKGKFKEEFVTCGGVALSNISSSTLECKNYPGLFFAGEVLDVDAITGGFNLQAAWTMGYVIAKALSLEH